MTPVVQSSKSWADLDAVVVREIENLARARGAPLRILEAGCGQKWSLDLGNAPFHLTGVDLDKDALDIRLNQRRDLHHAIHGDIATVDLPKNAFDVIYCSYVLEHVPDADVVLARMYEWLAPGGLLVLRLPAPESFRGFVTRVTPHWFHVAYYRWVKGQKNAGRPGHGPYPTIFHPAIRRDALLGHARARGLDCKSIHADTWRKEPFQKVGGAALRVLTRGRITDAYNDLMYILQAPIRAAAPS